MFKGMLVLGAGAIVGNMIAEKFLLKSSPDDTTGFIVVDEGLGMDDVARAAAIVGTILLLQKFIR
jgi:hypothetical protein